MIDERQNAQVETAAKLALQGGEYRYNSFPIGEAVGMNIPCGNSAKEVFDMSMLRHAQRVSSGLLARDLEFPETAGGKNGFVVEHPLEALRAEAIRTDRERHKLVAEKQVPTASYKNVGPKNALLLGQFLALLDKAMKKSKPKPHPSKTQVTGDTLRLDLQTLALLDRVEKRERQSRPSRSTMGRSASMDEEVIIAADGLMPLDTEPLGRWLGFLAKDVNQFDPKQVPHFQKLKMFCRFFGTKTWAELDWKNRLMLRGMVEGLAAAKA